MRTCGSEDLDCVERLSGWERGDTGDCLERCEGTIVDVTKLGSARKETVMDSFIRDYQRYKHPLSENLSYPQTMKGNYRGWETGTDLHVIIINLHRYSFQQSTQVGPDIFLQLYL